MSFSETKSSSEKYIMNVYNRFDVSIACGKGSTAFDEEGNKYIDFTSGIGVNSMGYSDDGWVNAVTEQLKKVQHTSNLFYQPAQAEFCKNLCEKSGFARVFLGNSGAEANECAIKIARKYSEDKYGESRSNIITLNNSFHGRTITTLSTTGQIVFHQLFKPLTDGFMYVDSGDIEQLKKAADDSVCAIMLETVQGEGGVLPVPADYIADVAQLCKERDILLIFDEVQTGAGRTGKLFSWEHIGIKPDIMTAAKGIGGGLPIGACLCNEKLKDVLQKGQHGSTFGGNPAVCAGADYVLKNIADEAFLKGVTQKGEYIKEKVSSMPGVEFVRGVGLLLGVKLIDDEARKCAENCASEGLLILTAKNLLRIMPPLNITYDEIDKGLGVLKSVLEKRYGKNS